MGDIPAREQGPGKGTYKTRFRVARKKHILKGQNCVLTKSKSDWQARQTPTEPAPEGQSQRLPGFPAFEHAGRAGGLIVALAVLLFSASAWAAGGAEQNEICLACHGDKSMNAKRGRRRFRFSWMARSLHLRSMAAWAAPLAMPISKAKTCRTRRPRRSTAEAATRREELYSRSLHGKAAARGDALAPRCVSCHGNHDILPVKDKRSAVAPLNIPFVCGKCHREGTPVQLNRNIDQHDILENYTESIHGEGCAEEGAYGGCHLRLMPYGTQHPSAHRSEFVYCASQHRGDLHQVSWRN